MTPPAPSPTLRLADVAFDVGVGEQARSVLQGIQLSVDDGERVAVVFPETNGGKTTLIHLCCGVLTPTRGTVWFEGHPVEARRTDQVPRLGVVFRDDGGLFPNMTLFENVALPLLYHDLDEDDVHRATQRALESVGLQADVERYPWELTRDRMRLAALARALVYRPRLVLIDDFDELEDGSTGESSVAWSAMRAASEADGTAFLMVFSRPPRAPVDRVVSIEQGRLCTHS